MVKMTVKKKKKVAKFDRFPHIPNLSGGRLCRSLLGKRLFWTIKEDGECVSVWTNIVRKKEVIHIASRNQENASTDIKARTMNTEEFPKVLQMIRDNPLFRVVVEECRKGRSVTGIKTYDRDQLFVIAIYDTAIENWLPYTLMYQTTYHYGLGPQTVKLFAETRHKTIKDLGKFKNHVLEVCDSQTDGKQKDEGMVCSTFDDDGTLIMAKVKLDIPEPQEKRIHEGAPEFPQIPVSEIMGSISKVEADFGLTGQAKDDMPRIAKYVSEACKEHLYSSRGNLFQYYQEYMDKMVTKKE